MNILKTMEKTDLEMAYLQQQIKKADLEIELLECRLKINALSQVNSSLLEQYKRVNFALYLQEIKTE